MPYRAPGIGDERVDWILTEINKAQRTLDARILEAQALPDTEPSKAARISRLNAMKREVDTAFLDLDRNISIWADRDISNFYRRGHATAAAQLPSSGFSFTLPHREALDLISHDAYDDVATRLQQVREGFGSTIELQKLFESLDPAQATAIREQGRSAVAQMLLTGEDPRKISKRLAQDLWSQGIQITDAGGRNWNPESYTRMLVRTKSANAYNAGSMNKYAEAGVSRVRVFDGVEDDQACAEANGQVWSLRYAMNHVIEHPNCRRAFAPEQGEGSVDKDTAEKYLVVFDRLELAVGVVAALRAFRATGEINVSSTLARLVIESAELAIGVPLPFIDVFAQGLLSGSFKSLDQYVESFVDPLLYSVGVIRNVPPRAGLKAALRPQNVIDEIANAVKKANREAFGVEFNPEVRRVLDRLDLVTGKVISGVRPVSSGEQGGLKYVDWVLSHLSGERFGEITAEAVRRAKVGEIDDLKSLWAESRSYVDDMKDIRRLYIESILRTQSESERILSDLDSLLLDMKKLMGDQSDIRDFPNVVKFLEAHRDIDLVDIERIIDYWSVQGRQIRLSDYEVQRMKEVFDQAFRIRNRALAVVEQMDEAIGKRGQRQLLMAAPSGPDFPSEANTLWDLDEFDDVVNSMRSRLAEVTNNATGYDPEIQEMFEEFFRMLTFDPNDVDSIPKLRAAVESFLTPNFNNTGLLVDPDDLPDKEAVLNFFIRVISGLKMQVDEAGRPVLTLFDDTVDDAFAREIAAVLDWLDDSFWDAPFRWREISDLHWNRDLIDAHLPVGTRDTGSAVKRVWRDFKTSVRANERSALSNPYGNLGEVLKRAYKGANVQTLGARGANGYIYEVIDEATGQKVLVKRIIADHTGGTVPTVNSLQITNLLADLLGDIEAVPTRFIQLTDNGGDWLVIMPYLEDTKMWVEISDDLLRDDVLRKFALFDALSLEGDAHNANYLANIFTETATIIDREMSFGVRGGFDPRVDHPTFGLITGSRQKLDKRLIDAWSAGEDIDFLKNAPPVRLHKLSSEELEALTGYLPDDVDRLLQSNSSDIERVFFLKDHGVVLSETGEAFIPTGRIGTVENFADEFPGGQSWWHSSFATESEFDFLEDLMDGVDAFDSRFYEDVRESLDDVYADASDEAREWFIDHWSPNANYDDALSAAADHITHNVRLRAEQLLSGGTVNISGGMVKHVDLDTGKELRYGDVVKLTNKTTGEEIEGLVVNLFQHDFRPVEDPGAISAVVRPGVGLNKTASELSRENLFSRTIRLDEWEWGEPVDLDLVSKINEYRRSIDDYADPLLQTRHPFDLRFRPVLDEVGIRIGVAEETVEIQNLDGTGIMKLVGSDGAERIVTFNDISNTPAIREIIDSELRRIAPEFRPKKVKLSFRKMATEDGRSAFGVFDPETGELHLSLAPLFDTPGLTSRSGIDNSWYYSAAIDDWRMSKESIQHWIGTLNVDGVRDVLRHELGHAVETGIERQNFNRWSLQVLEQLREEFPDLSLDDLRATAADLIPENFDRAGFPNDLAALIAYRAGLVEDVANTNLVFEAKELLEAGSNNRALPDWARAVYAGILREEPEAHHELFAEMWKRLNDLLADAPKVAIPRLAEEMGVEPDLVRRFLTRSGQVELPDVWDMSSEGFRRWMTDVLSPAADRIIPLEKNRNRMLWNSERYNIADIRQRVLHTPPEEGGGGITINLVTGEEPSEGFAVAKKANERIHENITTDEEFDRVVKQYIKDHKAQLSEPEWELGMWLDSSGNLYLDTTKVFDDQLDAAVFGFREQQRAMYDLSTFDEIKLLDGYEDIYGFIDDLPDFDVPYEEFLSRVERLSGVVKHIGAGADRVLEDQFERGGAFRVMSLEWMTNKDKKRVLDALRNRYTIPMTIEKGKSNLEEILERGLELYSQRPDLQDEYAEFYFRWRDDFIEAATNTVGRPVEISMPQISAAASRMSPALNADVNHDLVIDMADVLSRDLRVNNRIIREVEGIYERSKFLTGVRKRIEAGTANQKDLAYAASVEEILSELRPGRKINLLPPEARVRAVAGALLDEDKTAIQVSRTWYFYEEAVAVLLSEKTPAQILTDTKIRPFFNNILDPADLANSGEGTIDFIMAEAFFQARGFNNIGHTTPVVGGVSAGLRPVISDTLRVLYEERWAEELGLTSVSQLQSHIWNLWRYGVDHGWWTDLPTIGIR